MCVLIPSASAQWYLFPGSPQQKKEKAQQDAVKKELDRIHGEGGSSADTSAVEPAQQQKDNLKAQDKKREPWVFRPRYGNDDAQPVVEDLQEQADSSMLEEPVVDEFILDIPETINLALLLPLKTTGTPSSNFMEYYSGALMAVRNLGKKGINIDLNVFDTADSGARITDGGLADADIIIGPVSSNDIQSTLIRCPQEKFIVSPLEPKAAALADSCKVIQVPAASDAQLDELISWISQDMGAFDKLVVVKDGSIADGSESSIILNKLEQSGLPYSIIDSPSFGTLEQITGTLRILVASEKNSFLCSSVNAVGKLGASNGNVVLYSTSKLRSLEGINAESLFNSQCHMVSSYFIDYTDPSTKNFILSYRALFNAEPSSFAFHGYDSIAYFVSMCAEYGRQWYKKLPEKPWEGMQADFKFVETDKVGMINSAVRRVVYKQDLSIALQ